MLCFALKAQNIRYISEAEGLPQSFISGLAQDKQGFVWVATRNGLARYDGHDFKIFQQPLLASNAITYLHKSKRGRLWLKYETGEIDYMDALTGRAEHIITNATLKKYDLRIIRRGWCPDTENNIWYISEKNTLSRFGYYGKGKISKPINITFLNDTLRSVLNDTKKRIWVLSQKGISLYDNSKNGFRLYKMPYRQQYNEQTDYGADTPEIHEMANGNLMWSDLKNIFFFNPVTHSFSKTPLPEPVVYSVSWICTGPDKHDYFVAGKNLYCYNGISVNRVTTTSREQLQHIQAFLVDNSGLVWTGGNGNGITQIDPGIKFSSAEYKSNFGVDVLTNYLGFESEKVVLNGAPHRGVLPLSYYLRSVNIDNGLYIALGRAIYHHSDSGITPLPPLPSVTNGFIPIKGIDNDNENNVVVLDKGGNVYNFNPQVNKWRKVQLKNTPDFNVLVKGDPNYISIHNNRIFVTTEYEGLFYADIETGIVKRVPLPYGKCYYTIVPDMADKNKLWIGSPQGLIAFNPANFKTRLFNVSNGLPDNVVYSLLPDAKQNLWFGTNKGLVKFSTKSYMSRVFALQHGLPNNEFNRYHQLAFTDGRLAFGGIKGYTVFNSEDMAGDNFSPPTALTAIKVNNAALADATHNPINVLKKLELPYNENTLNIKYSALEFSQPLDIKYRYRLLGYDKKWVAAGTNREAIFTKIPPGNYEFQVNATNTTGKWSKSITTLPIKILHPWWNTWWAWCMYILAGGMAVAIFINFRIKQRIISKEMNLREKEAQNLRELDEMKTRFFANITHELRTPLTLILGPAEQLKESTGHREAALANTISENAGSLLNLTNQLLDIAKLEAGALKPHPQAGDIVVSVKRIVEAFEMQVAERNISIVLNVPEQMGLLYDDNMFSRILTNLLSNAIKHSPKNGKVSVSLLTNEFGIVLTVTDEGAGVAAADSKHIFQRFYSVAHGNAEAYSGTGIGLSLVKELAELQEGSVELVPKTDGSNGACFVVSLPLKAYTNSTVSEVLKTQPLETDLLLTEKPVVVIAEDNSQLAEFIESVLSPFYTVYCTADGDEALPLAQKIVPDLVISDVLMQRMGGYELCKALKSNDSTAHIPVMLLTAKADTESKISGLSIGADDYITKPFSVEELRMRVYNRLQQQAKLREVVRKEFSSAPHSANLLKPLDNDPFLKRLYETVDKNIDNDAFGVEQLADALSISRASLHRKAKTLTDMTSSELLRSYRLRRAAEFLLQHQTIAEAAYNTGFASPSYFTRSFKELYGITPTEYLKNIEMKQ